MSFINNNIGVNSVKYYKQVLISKHLIMKAVNLYVCSVGRSAYFSSL